VLTKGRRLAGFGLRTSIDGHSVASGLVAMTLN